VRNINTFKDRFTVLNLIVYLIGAMLIIQLFNLQIINGSEYRFQSEKRLVRETAVYAPRGEIFDRYGKQLVSNDTGYNLQIYKTKITNDDLNNILLKVANILEKNKDVSINNFPIDFSNMEFIDVEGAANWKEKNKLDINLSAEEVVQKFKEKYNILDNDIESLKKIIPLRYEISTVGYTNYKPVTLSRNISKESMMEIEERNSELSGINIYIQPIRRYEAGSTASHIIGYIGKISETEYQARKDLGYNQNDNIGKNGIEATFEDYLRGENGSKRLEMDSYGRISDEAEVSESKMGDSIILTLDLDLQAVTERVLEENIKKIQSGGFALQFDDAKTGAAVVMNVKTGEILAMASYPTYNPADFVDGISQSEYKQYFTNEDKPMFNRAIQGTYSPGSTFKMITGIAGLESGVITPTEKVNDVGVYNKGHKPACWLWNSRRQVHGLVDAETALKVSCNYYYYEVSNRVGIDAIAKYAKSFGLGEKTGVELIGEVPGILSSREYVQKLNEKGYNKTWTIGDTLSSSIGQSYNNFTPLQMCNYISTLANRGIKNKVSIVKQVIDASGNTINKDEVEQAINKKLGIDQINLENINIKKENLDAIFAGMKSVTGDSGGTAYGTFSSFPIEVAGKTGTATASSGSDNAWFVGFAPYDDPEIAVVVIVEHGGHGYYTAPAVKDIMEEYFGYNNDDITEDMELKPMKAGLNR
jgi:penicillin-binding protein 2